MFSRRIKRPISPLIYLTKTQTGVKPLIQTLRLRLPFKNAYFPLFAINGTIDRCQPGVYEENNELSPCPRTQSRCVRNDCACRPDDNDRRIGCLFVLRSYRICPLARSLPDRTPSGIVSNSLPCHSWVTTELIDVSLYFSFSLLGGGEIKLSHTDGALENRTFRSLVSERDRTVLHSRGHGLIVACTSEVPMKPVHVLCRQN